MKIFLLFLILIFSCAVQGQTATVITPRGFKSVYQLKNGRLTGQYRSFYYNGRKKSEGNLINGYRTGKWIVWDSAGRKRMERFYKNHLEYSRILPAISDDGPFSLLLQTQYPLEYDSNNVVKYASVLVDDAIWRHKYWRHLEPIQNKVLFEKGRLLPLLWKLWKTGQIQLYSTINDRFTDTLKLDTLKIEKAALIGLDIKEERFFDMNRLISECRILGICPTVNYQGRSIKLFWAYYPELRKYLAQVNVASEINSPTVKTLDDLFVFRDFASTITKTTVDNPFDLPIKDYSKASYNILKQPEIEELNIIESENDIWISLTK